MLIGFIFDAFIWLRIIFLVVFVETMIVALLIAIEKFVPTWLLYVQMSTSILTIAAIAAFCAITLLSYVELMQSNFDISAITALCSGPIFLGVPTIGIAMELRTRQ